VKTPRKISGTVLPFPERCYRPDIESLLKVIDTVEKQPGTLFDLALFTMQHVARCRGNPDPRPSDMQAAINGMALACFALALEIGIPREIIFGLLPDGGAR